MAKRKKKQTWWARAASTIKRLILIAVLLFAVDLILPHFFPAYRTHRTQVLQTASKLTGASQLKQAGQLLNYLQGKIFDRKPAAASSSTSPSSTTPVPIVAPKNIPPGDSIKIASFNIRIYSNNSRDEQELSYIADIVSQYDLVAVQEVRDEEVIKRTISALAQKGYSYDYLISSPVGNRVKERYAFLFRQGVVSVIQKGQLFPDQADHFIREPYYATFKAGSFDFTLATIHVLFGNSEQQRRPEIEQLSQVYQWLLEENPKEKDVIILGDFNFPPADAGFSSLLNCSDDMVCLIRSGKTTVGDKSLYDNFFFDQKHVSEYTGQCGIYDFDRLVFKNNIYLAKQAVSDHRPIWGEFCTTRDDD